MRVFAQLFVLFALLFGSVAAGGDESGRINVWSGRSQTLPVSEGGWKLTAEHGRLLASGQGAVTLHLPELEPGTFVDASLSVNHRETHRIRIWSPVLLPQPVVCDTPRLARIFQIDLRAARALPNDKNRIVVSGFYPEGAVEAPLTLVFPDRRAFPLPLTGEWEEITLRRGKLPGTLGILLDKKDRLLENNGDWSCAILRSGKRKVVIFSPDFDFSEIENILLLRSLLPKAEEKLISVPAASSAAPPRE